jgi:hypothetical protein
MAPDNLFIGVHRPDLASFSDRSPATTQMKLPPRFFISGWLIGIPLHLTANPWTWRCDSCRDYEATAPLNSADSFSCDLEAVRKSGRHERNDDISTKNEELGQGFDTYAT